MNKLKGVIQPACLPSKAVEIGRHCFVSGWGRGSGGKLNALEIRTKDCDYEYDPNIPSPDNEDFFCAISRVGSGCWGDSGGPMICEENDQVVLYGAVSTGEDYNGCGSNFDNIYANIYQHIELIETVLVRPLFRTDLNKCSD